MMKIFSSLLFLLVFFNIGCLTTEATNSSNIRFVLDEAEKAYVSGDYKIAEGLYNKAILSDPDQYEPFLGSAKSWIGLDDMRKALIDIDECIFLKPNEEENYAIKSYLLNLVGDYSEASDFIEDAIKKYPKFLYLYYIRAYMYEERGEYSKGIQYYTLAIKKIKKYKPDTFEDFSKVFGIHVLDRNGAALYFRRGIVKSKKGNFSGAKSDFKKALKLDSSLKNDLPEDLLKN